MATAQVIFYFSNGPLGWSEVWHKDGVTGKLKDFIFNTALQLGLKRVGLLTNESKLVAIKASMLDDVGDSWLAYFDLKGPADQHSDAPHVTLFTVFADSTGKKKKSVYLRGIPDDIDLNGGVFQPVVEPFRTNAQAWANAVTQGNWGWMTVNNGTAGTITGYVATADKRIKVTTKEDTFPAPGAVPKLVRARVLFKGQNSRLNGVRVYQVNDTKNATTVDKMSVFPFEVEGKIVVQSFDFVAASDFGFQKIGRRSCGRPSHLTPGRQKASPLG